MWQVPSGTSTVSRGNTQLSLGATTELQCKNPIPLHWNLGDWKKHKRNVQCVVQVYCVCTVCSTGILCMHSVFNANEFSIYQRKFFILTFFKHNCKHPVGP
jgi:hypothetical protein